MFFASTAVLNGVNVRRMARFRVLLASLIPVALGLATMALVCILADSLYFGHLRLLLDNHALRSLDEFLLAAVNPSLWPTIAVKGSLLITPLENLRYNLDAGNLAEHGIHPRYLHLLVNLPLLFGPLALLAIYDLLGALKLGRDVFADAHADVVGTRYFTVSLCLRP